MTPEEVIRLKDERDSLAMKCEDLNSALCCQMEENKKLKAVADNNMAINAELHDRVRFLEGQIEAYQYCLNCRR